VTADDVLLHLTAPTVKAKATTVEIRT